MAYILLVDDDDLLRDSLQQMLKLDGHDVLEATSGEEALRLSEGDSRIDLMLTDILMPVMDGGRLIVEMRQRRPGLPIIAMSAGRRTLTPQFNLETATLLGANCQLPKPFKRRDLQAAVQQALAVAVQR